jgi:hypothetical protein
MQVCGISLRGTRTVRSASVMYEVSIGQVSRSSTVSSFINLCQLQNGNEEPLVTASLGGNSGKFNQCFRHQNSLCTG